MRRVVSLFVAISALACERSPAPAATTFGPGSQVGGQKSRAFGADCNTHGASDCASGLCFRHSDTSATCTRLCGAQMPPCENGWQCRANSSAGASLCVPKSKTE